MPSSNIVYIDVKIEKLYLIGVRIMIAWYRSGHLTGNGGEFSDGEGLRDGEEELWLVPNLGPLHAADAPLHDRYSNHLDSIKLVQAGEHQTQVGNHTDVMLDDHLHNTRTFRIDS